MSQPVSHAADVASGLIRREFGRVPAQTLRGLADPFQAALDGVTRLSVALNRLPVHANQVGFDPLGVLDDVRQTVDGLALRRRGLSYFPAQNSRFPDGCARR